MIRRNFLQALGLISAAPLIPRLPETPYEKKYVRTKAEKPKTVEPKKQNEPISSQQLTQKGTISFYLESTGALLFNAPLANISIEQENDPPIFIAEFGVRPFRPAKMFMFCKINKYVIVQYGVEKCLGDNLKIIMNLEKENTTIHTEGFITDISYDLHTDITDVCIHISKKLLIEHNA